MAVVIRNNNLFCTCCGTEYVINYPCKIDEMIKTSKVFEQVHKKCKQTYVEPTVNPQLNAVQKAYWWLANGERGMSSETMWHCFMDEDGFEINFPYDPDDFKRCYKLLETVPEWKNDLHKLRKLSATWSNLVDNWDKLTEMYEENIRTDWKEYKRIGMYEFMQSLRSNS